MHVIFQKVISKCKQESVEEFNRIPEKRACVCVCVYVYVTKMSEVECQWYLQKMTSYHFGWFELNYAQIASVLRSEIRKREFQWILSVKFFLFNFSVPV